MRAARRDELNGRLEALKKELRTLKKEVVNVDRTRKKEVQAVEQEKRRAIIVRAGKEVPYYSHSGVTSQSRPRSQLTKSNRTHLSKSPREALAGQKRRQRGNQRN